MAIYWRGKDRRTGEGKWYIVVHLHGLRRDCRITGSKEQAKAQERTIEDELRLEHDRATGRIPPPVHVPTFLAFCAKADANAGIDEDGRYYRHLQNAKRFTERTRANRAYTLATLASYFAAFRLDEIEPKEVIDYQEERAEAVEASTINTEVKVLRAVLNFATSVGIPRVNALKKKDVPDLPEDTKLAEAWTSAEVTRLLERSWEISHRLWAIVLLLANTGMRRGEALNLQWDGEWSRVDLDAKMITLRPSKWWRPKNKSARKIPIDGVLHEYLKANFGRFPFVVTSRKGERYAFWPQKVFDEARRAAGLRGGPHRLRHTFASHFLAKVPDLFLLAEVLGHEHARITKIYTHLLPDHLDRARGAVNFGGESRESKARARWSKPRGRRPKKGPAPSKQPDKVSDKVLPEKRASAGFDGRSGAR